MELFSNVPNVLNKTKNELKKEPCSCFALLKLPLLALEVVINQMEFADVIESALRSTHFNNFLKVLKYPVQMMEWKFDGYFRNHLTIQRGEKSIYFKFYGSKVNDGSCDFQRIDSVEEKYSIFTYSKPKEMEKWTEFQLFEKLTYRILKFLRVQEYSLILNHSLDSLSIQNCFVLNITSKFTKIEFEPIEKFEMQTVNDLKFLTKNLSTQQISIKLPKILRRFKVIEIETTKLGFLLNMNCEIFNISLYDIWGRDIRKVIKKWMAGELENLKALRAESTNQEYANDWDHVLDGCNAKPTASDPHPLSCDWISEDRWKDEAKDFFRPLDGKRASVILEESVFWMYIWE